MDREILPTIEEDIERMMEEKTPDYQIVKIIVNHHGVSRGVVEAVIRKVRG